MRLLLHVCCGNCALYPLGELYGQGFDLRGYWFNPNIHPNEEYSARLSTVMRLADMAGVEMIYNDLYGEDMFVETVRAHDGLRCEACYRMRLRQTASEARQRGIETFSTTLLVSPYQDHELIMKAANEAEDEFSVRFHYEDFRPGFRAGQREARQLGHYMQGYCGCLYSREERLGRSIGKDRRQGETAHV